MTPEHPSDARLHAWAAGELEPAEQARLEAHVDACADCADRLTRAASVELALSDIAEASLRAQESASPSAAPPPRRSGIGVVWAMAGLAAAALALFALLPREDAGSADGIATVDVQVDCRDVPDAERCIDAALERGVMALGGGVPRYEDRQACLTCGRSR